MLGAIKSPMEKTLSSLIILAAPSICNVYYKDHFKDIIDFQRDMAEKVMLSTSDKILIFADDVTYKICENSFPPQILRKFRFSDIWIRDFSPPAQDLSFKYSTSYENDIDAPLTWIEFAKKTGINFKSVSYELDGGNVVHNGKDKLIVSRRFLEDNRLKSIQEGITLLKSLFTSYTSFAIIPYDDPVLGHADGMVSFLDDNVLLMIKFNDQKLYKSVKRVLRESFPDVKIVEIETEYSSEKYRGVYSAKGCYANILATSQTLYVPIFGIKQDESVLKVISKNTSKKVIPIFCEKVSILGGNVRCLTWVVEGENAEKILDWKGGKE